MNLIRVPSLEHLALAKIGTTLWDHRSIKTSIESIAFKHYDGIIWKEIEKKVLENASLLHSSGMLREKIRSVIKPIGSQIKRWFKKKVARFDFPFNERYELCWTSEGTLDKKKTAKAFVVDETRDAWKRYTVACYYCLESDIRTIWYNTPESCRGYFFKTSDDFDSDDFDIEDFDKFPLVDFWIDEIKREQDEMENFTELQEFNRLYVKVVKCARDGNRLALEYFFNKLTPGKRGSAMRGALKSFYLDWDIVHFFLSQADEDEREHMFKTCPCRVLEGFLRYPYQVYFTEMTNHMSSFLNAPDWYMILCKIVSQMKKGYKDYDYQQLFEEFWQKMQTSFKKRVIRMCDDSRYFKSQLLLKLSHIKDVKNILMILKDASAEESHRLCHYDAITISQNLAKSQDWNLLDSFLGEFISSTEEMVRFKEECKDIDWEEMSDEDMSDEDTSDVHKEKFFQLLDGFVQRRFKKRSAEEEESCSQSIKRIRSCSSES